ncbi:MAG: AMP-binding protein [Spirochaetia bacterium]|nr:AMP-binding protein [Spirochaetia bacterium]
MKHLHLIHQDKPELQLREFTSNLGSCIPIIAPRKLDDSIIEAVEIPKEADFAVASSGTTGKPKLYFRTKRSWTDFFPEQDELFSINSSSRIFIHGSLAFTGNLNIAYEAVENGAFLHCESSFRAQVWAEEILKNRIDTIYLIPDKLLHLVRHGGKFENIRTIICGSQFISEKLFEMTRLCFPNAKIILYYGSSEVNYVSYNVLNEKPAHENCVGKIFDSIKVKFSPEGNILVDSPFSVCGISGYYDTKDKGYLKDGLLYLNGRSDDQLNILGEKINACEIKKRLLQVSNIEECEISVEEKNSKKIVVAHISGKDLPSSLPNSVFDGISPVFIPQKYIHYEKLPRNESGKICLR